MARRNVISTAVGTRPAAFGVVEWGLLAAIAGMWGSSFVFIAEGLEAFQPGLISLGRLLLGAAALALIPSARQPIAREDWPAVAVLSLFWMAIPLVLFPIAQQWIDSALTGMLNGAMPLFSAAVAAVLLRRLPRGVHAAGLTLGFIGVIIVSWPAVSGASVAFLGAGLVLLGTLMYGIAVNLAVPLQQRYGSLPVLLRVQIVAIALVLPFGIGSIPGSSFQLSSLLALVALGVFGTGWAFVAMATLVGRAGATRGGVAIYFIPIVAIVLGVTFRDDVVPLASLLGVALVIGGAYLTSRKEVDSSPAA